MIYFDNSATTKPDPEVLETFLKVNHYYYANPSSIHSFGGKVEKLLQQARAQFASILMVKENEVYFTSGGTESNNTALKGTAFQYHNRGKHIITTSIEHPSIIESCEQLKNFGFDITYLTVDGNGVIDPNELKKAIREETILVSVMHVNNEVGSIQPIDQIGQLLKNYPKILFHVDHVQGYGKVELDLTNIGIDLCTISAHKLHGLKGSGLLYIRDGVQLSPLITGGEQERKVRSGTENTSGIVAFAKAIRLEKERSSEGVSIIKEIHEYLRTELSSIEGISIHTPETLAAPHILNFSVKHYKGEVIVHALEEMDIYVSTTSACSSKKNIPSRTLLAMGRTEEMANSSIRVSLAFENTMEEAIIFIQSLKKVISNLDKVMRRSV
ncbi:cysteine desulfurase [Bacillus pakistanensis]|uniref:Cysteine desulfurase n=1 Tax=Rossellomorea pakistanensis TaxID=992288 RepID=A0ABS2NAY5_9BACI|nr:cysteine desulfurase family protein [Bacillus pakistanensis]MBM7584970.1 cysteine desulfurase [Bacillus pakistanensis]